MVPVKFRPSAVCILIPLVVTKSAALSMMSEKMAGTQRPTTAKANKTVYWITLSMMRVKISATTSNNCKTLMS